MILQKRTTITEREQEVLQGLSEGLTSKEIGKKLFLAEETIKWYRKSLLSKLDAKNSFQLAIKSIKIGLLEYGAERMAS